MPEATGILESGFVPPVAGRECPARNHAIVAHCSLNDRDIAELRPQGRIVIPYSRNGSSGGSTGEAEQVRLKAVRSPTPEALRGGAAREHGGSAS
jgi:hypothetical protein